MLEIIINQIKIGDKIMNSKMLGKKKISEYKAQKMASYLNHTATTDYLCCVPTLEEFQELVV